MVELWPSKADSVGVCVSVCACVRVCVLKRAWLVWSHRPQACETARLLSTQSDNVLLGTAVMPLQTDNAPTISLCNEAVNTATPIDTLCYTII